MKLGIFADPHLFNQHQFAKPVKPGDIPPALHKYFSRKSYESLLTDRLCDGIEAVRRVFFECREREIETVYLLGDLFHQKNPGLAFVAFSDFLPEALKEFKIKQLYTLAGNHDSFYDWSYIQTIEGWGNRVKFILDPAEHMQPGWRILLVPYYHRASEWTERLRKLREKSAATKSCRVFLFHHQLIKGWQAGGISSGAGIDPSSDLFKGIDLWVGGHIHQFQELKGGLYVGSPLGINFAESAPQHGFVILDTESAKAEFVPLEGPRFQRLLLGDISKLSKLAFFPGTEYVWLDVSDPRATPAQLERIRDLLSGKYPASFRAALVKNIAQLSLRGGSGKVSPAAVDKRKAVASWAIDRGMNPDYGVEIYDKVSGN